MLNFLFPQNSYPTSVSLMLLALRLLFGGVMMWHGITKMANYENLVSSFPNPLGLGSHLSLYLAIFAELFCSVGVIFGAFYRMALIPLIFTMIVAFFIIHHSQPFASKELAFIYLVMFILLFVMGAGRFSLDNIIAAQLTKNRAAEYTEY
ncbi:MAG: DoxX family protein [Alistipes sp.]|jgi:putative oxidoreductase|nr:DoxX family protein [Alistipes sp.]MBQ5785778.1 DoxX family protein [Alistipes sp.]MBQ5913988.1 DoxX family protein [Alistipes sp.]